MLILYVAVAVITLLTIAMAFILSNVQAELTVSRDERMKENEWLAAKVDSILTSRLMEMDSIHSKLDAVLHKAEQAETPEAQLRRTIVQMAHALVDSTVALRKPEALPSSRRATEVALRGPGYVENPDPANHATDTFTLWRNAEEV